VIRLAGYEAEIVTLPDMPTGPLNRVADSSLARKLLGRELQVSFYDGLKRTFDWYFAAKDREQVRWMLEKGALLERKVESLAASPA